FGTTTLQNSSATASVTTIPDPPVLSISSFDFQSVTLGWTAVNGGNPDNYAILRGATAGGESMTPIATVSGSTLTYTDPGLTASTTYFYKVYAIKGALATAVSNEVSQQTAPPPWTNSNGIAPTSLYGANVLSLASHGTNLYAGTAGRGIFVSADGGVTWL